MAESAGVPYSQMEPVVHAVDARYPGIKRFMKSIEDIGMRRLRSEGQGYVMTARTGRKLPCDDDKIYALTNYLHQGHAAEIFKRALVDLDMAGWADYMVLPVHDEILLDVPDEHDRRGDELGAQGDVEHGRLRGAADRLGRGSVRQLGREVPVSHADAGVRRGVGPGASSSGCASYMDQLYEQRSTATTTIESRRPSPE